MVASVSDASLLPSSATPQERALDLATSRVGDVPAPIREIWNADTCPADKLVFLAWAFSVDEWDEAWSDEAKRATIRDAVEVQARKGSVWSIRRVLANAGYGTAQLIEGLYGHTHDGSSTHNGLITYGDPTEWAKYRAILDRPISNKQAPQVRRMLEVTAPARCRLEELIYTAANNIYDGTITYDGLYNHGTA